MAKAYDDISIHDAEIDEFVIGSCDHRAAQETNVAFSIEFNLMDTESDIYLDVSFPADDATVGAECGHVV